MWTPLTQALVAELKKLQVSSVTTDKKEMIVRCPICGDSKKHTNSAHLYIKLDIDEDSLHTYYCQKCKSKGAVDSSFLKLLKIFNNELNIALGINLKKVAKANKKYKIASRERLIIPTPDNSKLNRIKLGYFNKRLGTDLSLDDLPRYKIITNLYDLLDANKIDFLTNKNQDFVDLLDKNFFGFVSYDNNYVILRNTGKIMPDLRYYNYNIFGNYDNSKRFYSMPTKIDILQSKLNVVISEGIFDVLGVYFNIESKHPQNNTVYLAVNGVGYNLIFQYLAKQGFLDMNIRIYSDNDQPLDNFRKMKQQLKIIIPNKMEVYFNKKTKEKDFGVTLDRIKISRVII